MAEHREVMDLIARLESDPGSLISLMTVRMMLRDPDVSKEDRRQLEAAIRRLGLASLLDT